MKILTMLIAILIIGGAWREATPLIVLWIVWYFDKPNKG